MSEKVVDVTDRYSREINEIGNKLKQLEEGRVYEPKLGKCGKMDGSLHTNIIQLKEMLNDLIYKIEHDKKSINEEIGDCFSKCKI